MDTRLVICHTNDIHNHLPEDFSGFGEFDLLLDAGDAISGSNTAFHFREPVLRRMKLLGYNAMAMGNREFHYIRSIMKWRREEAGFPILSANLFDISGKSASIIDPFIIKEIKGLKIAILGLTVQILPPGCMWEKIMKFKFLDPLDTVKNYACELKKKADLLFLLSHLGKDVDIRLAGTIKEIDVIIGGHSHSPLEKPLRIANSLVLQAGFHAKSFGRLILFLKDKKIVNHSFELVPIKTKG